VKKEVINDILVLEYPLFSIRRIPILNAKLNIDPKMRLIGILQYGFIWRILTRILEGYLPK
jgi:hypothetical protein